MARKGTSENKARATAPKRGRGQRVIALQSFEGHGYGQEFEMPKGAELDRLVKEGKVRIDDRMPGGRDDAASDVTENDSSDAAEVETK